ncbi:MAG: hypothetical protein VB085_08930 [Peptococcaceae bacterium]|nr:hypothetical protein [Peptococcaceae bacterium]
MAMLNGMIQIVCKDPSGRISQIIMQNTASQFGRSTTPSEQLPMEKKPYRLYEAATLEIWMKPDAAGVFDVTSVVNIPITQYIAPDGRANSGKIYSPAEIMLTGADFGIAADIVLNAGAFGFVGKYTVPAGVAVDPGWGGAETLDAAKGRIYISAVAG